MSKVSAVIIAKNEEEMIADCLDSLGFCDEIIVIDDTSDGRTAEIAKYKGAKVYTLTARSFAERRNFAIKKAKNEWILYVDADERVSNELAESIKEKIENKKDHFFAAFKIQRKNYYLGKHEWPVIEQLERLFQKKLLVEWYGDLHETPKVLGEIGVLDGCLLHFTHRDLSSMLRKTNAWSTIEAELRYKNNHPKMTWWRFPRVMITAFIDSYVSQKGYKVGLVGLIESIFQSYSMFITYAKLWEMQTIKKKNEK